MRILALAACATLLSLAGCSDSNGPDGTASSRFNPFPASGSASEPSAAPPPATLAVGDCFDTDAFSPGLSIHRGDVHLVACADPHQHEVYAIESHPSLAGDAFPSDAAMRAFADDACLAAFEPALGVDYRTSTLDFATITPDAPGWEAGDRAVICAVHDADFDAMTGSRLAPTAPTTTTPTSLAPETG